MNSFGYEINWFTVGDPETPREYAHAFCERMKGFAADSLHPLSGAAEAVLLMCDGKSPDEIVQLYTLLAAVERNRETSYYLRRVLAQCGPEEAVLVYQLCQPLPGTVTWDDIDARDHLLRRADWVLQGRTRAVVPIRQCNCA